MIIHEEEVRDDAIRRGVFFDEVVFNGVRVLHSI